MSPGLDRLLCDRYPAIFAKRHLPIDVSAMHWGVSCEHGWFALIDGLCAKLQASVEVGEIPQPVAMPGARVVTPKEKQHEPRALLRLRWLPSFVRCDGTDRRSPPIHLAADPGRPARRPYDVGLVVHSTWRYTFQHTEIHEFLGALGGQFLSTTPRGPRQASIQWWLQMHPQVIDYRVIDDDPSEFDEQLASKLIRCSPLDGLRDAKVQAQIRDWLGRSRPSATS